MVKLYLGTRHLKRHLKLLRSKVSELRKKFVTFESQVSAFNSSFENETPIECPDFNEVKSSSIEDRFWDFGQLTHPEEVWATNVKLQDGIKWYLDVTHSEDELRRIGRECRQLMRWAVETEIIYSRSKWIEPNVGSSFCLHLFVIHSFFIVSHVA